jgi:RNA polymerase sigma-70 factor (ECF subfamily)
MTQIGSCRRACGATTDLQREQAVVGSAEEVELLDRVRAHDADALLAVYRLYGPRLFFLALRILDDPGAAEEVVQDTFWKLWQRPEMFDPERGVLLAWLYRVGRNLALDRKRKDRRRVAECVPDSLDGYTDGDIADTFWRLDDPSVIHAVRDAIDSLPSEQKHAIELAYFEGMTQSEIAEHIGLALGTVKTRIRLGLRKLRDTLQATRRHPFVKHANSERKVKR